MSRETNSLLLRYGLNLFWSTSISSSNLLYSRLQFDSFFILYLRNYHLRFLKIQYLVNSIYVYIFYFKEDRFSFIYKFLKLKKIAITRLFLRKYYSFYFNDLKKVSFKKCFLISLFYLTNKIILSYAYYTFLKKKECSPELSIISIFSFIPLKPILKKSSSSLFWNWKLNFINYLIKFRWLALFSSILISVYTNKNFKIVFKSLTEKSGIRFPFIFKYFKNYSLKQKFYLLLLSLYFFKTSLLTTYISLIIKKTKNKKHINTLIAFFKSFNIIFLKQILPISGLKFKIVGRLNGKLRKNAFGYKLGFLKLMSFNIALDYTCDFVYTQFGSFSLKLWFISNTEQNLLS